MKMTTAARILTTSSVKVALFEAESLQRILEGAIERIGL